MTTFAVILPAAGRSSRFTAQKRKKPFVELKGRAIWLRAAEQFVNREDVVQTIIAVSADDMEWFKQKFRPNLAFMNIEIIEGGAERADTVERAVALIRDDVDFIAVHDAARPLLIKDWIDAVFSAAEKSGAAIPALPVSSTLKRVGEGNRIAETVSREQLWQAQTPQVFRRELLQQAFANRGDFQPTDEAELVERAGGTVTVVEGWPMNIKITTFQDFKMAEALVNALPKPKTLRALHPFADEDPRIL
ncbi:MAG: 2-C-methyl-D-erythritol 4-phosphate cytidylyltransferase [Planctomycetes bacterium]|nr:2-C-methyl-D-erythritol 4-phosphate cytidylyltransferase [Planctomycetota bacterium]